MLTSFRWWSGLICPTGLPEFRQVCFRPVTPACRPGPDFHDHERDALLHYRCLRRPDDSSEPGRALDLARAAVAGPLAGPLRSQPRRAVWAASIARRHD